MLNIDSVGGSELESKVDGVAASFCCQIRFDVEDSLLSSGWILLSRLIEILDPTPIKKRSRHTIRSETFQVIGGVLCICCRFNYNRFISTLPGENERLQLSLIWVMITALLVINT